MKHTARHKLNAAAINGCLIISGIAGLFFQSWTVFLLVGAALLLIALCSGDIRLDSDRRPRR